METEQHKWLKRKGLQFLRENGMNVVANEVQFKCGIADCCGLNFKRKEVRIIEAKQSLQDYIRDKKLFDLAKAYYTECHYFYIICPHDIIPLDKVLKEIGLIYAYPDDTMKVVQKPKKNVGRLRTLFETSLKRTVQRLSNELFFQDEKHYTDITKEKYKRKAKIFLSAIRCPYCKHVTKELIHKEATKSIRCSHCKQEINLEHAKVREITGFNNVFIKKINELNEL